jgi:hypothetical protein
MWNLVRRAINRWLAAIFIAAAGWFAKRYAAPVLIATVGFALFAWVNHHVGDWANGLGHFIGLIVPALLLAVSLMILVWAIQSRAIEPTPPSSTLAWGEEEMAEVVNLPDRESA